MKRKGLCAIKMQNPQRDEEAPTTALFAIARNRQPLDGGPREAEITTSKRFVMLSPFVMKQPTHSIERESNVKTNIAPKEESFSSRPSVRVFMPDNIKSLLVDDWENVTKNQQVVALPAKAPVNQILDDYHDEEKPKRATSADLDVLEEVVMGVREYFDKSLDKILLYKFEREQYRTFRRKWENGSGSFADKGPLDIYGAEHLTRLFCMFFSSPKRSIFSQDIGY